MHALRWSEEPSSLLLEELLHLGNVENTFLDIMLQFGTSLGKGQVSTECKLLSEILPCKQKRKKQKDIINKEPKSRTTLNQLISESILFVEILLLRLASMICQRHVSFS